MRVLVEQTRDCAVRWLHNIGLLGGEAVIEGDKPNQQVRNYEPWAGADSADRIRVHLLMGGDVDRDWDMYPERDAILIGTQDMLLSRALNRGYAMSRFRWPVQFALLNNDCVWVMDEVQLMGNGVATTSQLQAFRRLLGTTGNVRSTWMSATMRPEWLATVNFESDLDAPGEPVVFDPSREPQVLRRVFEADKSIEKAAFDSTADGNPEADLLASRHIPGTRTLMVVNTVKRAQAVYGAMKKKGLQVDLVLLHSRFRSADREQALSRLLVEPGPQGTIAVSTQVVEAGVDVSARILVTDLAPWSSLVQRFGRCNRTGERKDAQVVWVPQPDLTDDKKLRAAPYEAGELRDAAVKLASLADVGPKSLPPVTGDLRFNQVVRRKDVIELFDTTPDLAGADIDVSRFIREADEHNLHVFWRDLPDGPPKADAPQPAREELCAVPWREFDAKKRNGWRWDYLEKCWKKVKSVFAGLVLMLRADEGGYDGELGWTGRKGHVEPVNPSPGGGEGYDDDRHAQGRVWQTLASHTDAVVAAVERLLATMRMEKAPQADDLRLAARWHDAGKAHAVFQAALPDGKQPGIWGKSPGAMKRYDRPGFRHEFASAIAMLLAGETDLAAYLAAAHHGKVRLSVRSLPHEKRPSDSALRFARGIWDGDLLPGVDLGSGVTMLPTTLDLSFMELGEGPRGPSWLARMLALRDDDNLGAFRLAFLEALMRIADWRASEKTEVSNG